jgi:hypothetical protein
MRMAALLTSDTACLLRSFRVLRNRHVRNRTARASARPSGPVPKAMSESPARKSKKHRVAPSPPPSLNASLGDRSSIGNTESPGNSPLTRSASTAVLKLPTRSDSYGNGASPLMKSTSAASLSQGGFLRNAWEPPGGPQLTAGASAYDNGNGAYNDADNDDVGAMLAENKLVADKSRAEAALAIAQDSLARATARIEQQKLQIASLSGRGVAMKVASEEASLNGKTWDIDKVRRFSVLPKGPPDFVNDALREMLDQAVLATDRRVRGAINEGIKARSEADKADSGVADRLEAALLKCKSPEAEHALRNVTRDMVIQNTRCTKLLRNACKRLEDEATSALFAHAADLRSMGARLVAERDAIASCVLDELQRAEVEGSHSMHGLSADNSHLHGELSARDEEIVQLKAALADMQLQLKHERASRRAEEARTLKDWKIVRAEFKSAEGELATNCRDLYATDRLLSAELEREEKDRHDEAMTHQVQMEQATVDAQARVTELQAKLKALKIEARTMHSNLTANFKALESEFQQQEAKHALQLKATENEYARERSFFEGKLEALGKKLLVLRSSTARGRAMLYWTSMNTVKKVADKVGDDLPWSPESDVDDEDGTLLGTGTDELPAWREPKMDPLTSPTRESMQFNDSMTPPTEATNAKENGADLQAQLQGKLSGGSKRRPRRTNQM